MARPRLFSDDDLLDAAEAAVGEHGPAFRLEDVARPLGISAQALLHRYGSKHALVLAVAERRARRAAARMAARTPDGVDGSPLRAMLDFFERRMRSRDYARRTLASGMAFMLAGVSDDEIRPHIATMAAAIRANLYTFVSSAVQAGELRGDAEEITMLIEAAYNGSMYLWLIDRQGTAWSYFAPRLTALLAPYRAPARRGRRRPPRPARRG